MIDETLFPLLLTAGVGIASWGVLRRWRAPRWFALVVEGLELALAVVATTLIAMVPEEPNQRNPDETCPVDEAWQSTSAEVLAWVMGAVAGVVVGAVVADVRRAGKARYWHVLVIPAAALLPYLVYAQLVWAAFCGSS